MNLIVIDVETSDLDPDKGAKLLELAWIELADYGQGWEQVSSAEFYIEQPNSIFINPHAQAVHHIRVDMLTKEKGAISRYEVIQTLLPHLSQDTILVAHNAAFDAKFLPEINYPWICTYRAAKHIWPGAPAYSNQVLRYWLKIEPAKTVEGKYPHQALYDVATTTGILLKMLEKHTPEQLLILSKEPVRLKTIGFGKHRGMDFNLVPREYLQWLRAQANLDDDLKHTLDSILKP